MARHSSALAWKIPWTEEPGGLQSRGLLRVRHDWATSLSRTGEGNGNPLSVLAWRVPGTGEPGGLPSMGSHRAGHDWSDSAAGQAKPMDGGKQSKQQLLLGMAEADCKMEWMQYSVPGYTQGHTDAYAFIENHWVGHLRFVYFFICIDKHCEH